jgi:CheY-like chemotaxis protein
MPKLVVTTKALAGLTYELGAHWVTIGRALTNNFQIPENSVSGVHCEVRMRGEELQIRDMRSTNGTFIRTGLITEGSIKLGENFRIGEVDIWFEPSEPVPAPRPRISITHPADSNRDSLPAREPSRPTKHHHVLLVDDSMAFLETLAEMFELYSQKSWEIYKAATPDQALAMLQQHPIELAVLDINMPMLDGVQLLSVLARRHPEVKRVVLTGHATGTYRTQCLANGAELFLEKPVTPDGLKSIFNLLNDLLVWSQREGFSGTLRQVGLTDVIQIECLRRSSCVLEVHNREDHGVIFIKQGAIIHATAGALHGEEALYRLLSMGNGEFRVQAYKNPPARTISGSWEYLLMESARLCDESRQGCSSADTVMLTKPATPLPTDRADQALATSALDLNKLCDLDESFVVVSTYDGEWHPVDGVKR